MSDVGQGRSDCDVAMYLRGIRKRGIEARKSIVRRQTNRRQLYCDRKGKEIICVRGNWGCGRRNAVFRRLESEDGATGGDQRDGIMVRTELQQ